ncbi:MULTISPECIES: baseplate J/gp47 family protein [unclassified Serratia (in: enterobacteria)]|uniref:baseplate assembly protein n=1 Tax=unclassified Serratia (in: enterobacteria) TaxID=2647522 RepID=UPI0005029C89|nr:MULTISPECIES: baseplate J/gp47 family protein [unclassified Serratia (in: enterobacteria)]KFK91946.1 baseplate protein [Serratia sp. Ag2]KFK92852.1 baseplate protein [Serratia sp. Ag1]
MALSKPDFIERDADKITAEMVAKYEADSGKTLYPAQAERLLINLFAYRENLVRVAIQEAAEQNLVAFAREPMLDYLGELVGVYRLSAQPAHTVLQFSIDTALPTSVLIPAGTRVSATDSVIFATDNDVVLVAGQTLASTSATCTEPGTMGNGWQPTQVSTLLDPLDDIDLQVTNTQVASGGAEQEDNERLRERIRLAPESFSNAGSRGAYRFHAMSAHQDIIDVGISRPRPGTVALYPLMRNGLPDDTILALVSATCSDEKARPLTDTVWVKQPVPVGYRIDAILTLYEGQNADSTQKAGLAAAESYAAERAAGLGRDIVPSELVRVLKQLGVYDVELTAPALTVVSEIELAVCTGITITLKGSAHG